MWSDGLQLPETLKPPAWHVAGDSNDPLSVPLASGIQHFQEVNSFASAWGPLGYAKDGWWAEIVGAVVIPASTDTLLITMPAAYRRPVGKNTALMGQIGNFGDVVNPAVWMPCTLMLFDNGWLRYFTPTSPPAYMTSLFLGARYLTTTYGE
jgi:hypothetical protein